MTIEKLITHIKHEIKCHTRELDEVIKEKEDDDKGDITEKTMSNFVRGIQLKSKIDQLEVLLMLCEEDENGMINLSKYMNPPESE